MIYATVFNYGSSKTICSRHKTYHAAEKEAIRCEKQGGAHHEIWEIRVYRRRKKK